MSRLKTYMSKNYIHFNANPDNNETFDCSLRAYCSYWDMSWDDAYDMASEFAKKHRLVLNDDVLIDKLMKHKGLVRHDLPKPVSVSYFTKKIPTGKYMVCVSNHMLTVKDGKYYDRKDSVRRMIKYYYTDKV